MLRELEPYATGLGPYGLAGVLLLSTLVFLLAPSYGSRLPLVNGKGRFEFQSTNAKRRFVQNAQNLIQGGLAKVRDGATPSNGKPTGVKLAQNEGSRNAYDSGA